MRTGKYSFTKKALGKSTPCRICCAETLVWVCIGYVSSVGRRWQFCLQLRGATQGGAHAPRQGRQTDAAAARTTEAREREYHLRSGATNSCTPIPRCALRSTSSCAAGTRNNSGVPACGTVSAGRRCKRLGTISERSDAGSIYGAVSRKLRPLIGSANVSEVQITLVYGSGTPVRDNRLVFGHRKASVSIYCRCI